MVNRETQKKILFIVTKSSWGGAQRYVYDLSISLKEAGFIVDVAMGGNGVLKDKLKEKNIETHKVEDLNRNISILKELGVFFALIKLYIKIKPDILHLNSSKIGGLGSIAGRITGIKKIVFTAHGWAFNENRSPIQNYAIKLLSYLTIMFCHKIIVLSEKEKSQVIKWPFIKENKIKVIQNGINVNKEEANLKTKEEAREIILKINPELEKHLASIWIGSIGELHKNKGYEYALDAIARNADDFKYIIVGEGEDRNKLEKTIENHPILKDKVFLTGNIKNAGTLMKAFDILLLPSIKEGLPYVLLEAGLAKTPMIATYTGGIPELIKSEENGLLIKPKEPEEINTAIFLYLENPELKKRVVINMYKKITENLTFKDMYNKTIDIYSKEV